MTVERRTYIRRMADRSLAGVLRENRSRFAGEWIEVDQCEDARRENRGESEWTDHRCELSFGHSGPHISYGQEWED